MHNRTSAWKARQARGGVTTQEAPATAAPVSMARATLDQRLAELPGQLAEHRQYLDDIVATIKSAGDIEAAGAEVADAHRDALTKITEADQRAATVERDARLAKDRAAQAERDREEADAVAEEATAETDRVRVEALAEIAGIQTAADAAVATAQQQLATATAEHQRLMSDRAADLAQAQQEAHAATVEAAAARAAHEAADAAAERERDTAAQLRTELDQTRRDADVIRQRLQADLEDARRATQRAEAETASVRLELATANAELTAAQRVAESDRQAAASLTRELERHREDARAEREALRATHTEQLTQAQRNADERVQTLTDALTVAREVAETYRAQLPAPSEPVKRATPRKRTQS